MTLESITTQRFKISKSFWQIVFEWEDIFSEVLSVNLVSDSKLRENKIISHIPRLSGLFSSYSNSLMFSMTPTIDWRPGLNKKNIIPCIIDYYLPQEKIKFFEQAYSKHKCVLISSREVYDFLKERNCRLPIKHLALSLSDKYKINERTKFNKKYDLVLMGRPNSVLLSFLDKYVDRHPEFNYVYNKLYNHKYSYFTSDGIELGTLEKREEYFALMRSARATFYSTPGIDGGEKRTNGFNQVTPRFLEQVASGCHIIARYPKNSDTEYFELDKFSTNINNYENFEKALDKARTEDIDIKMYSEYLSKHYTSVRAKQLREILKEM